MAKLNLSLNPKQILSKLTQNLGLLFFVTFMILLVLEGVELKKSVDIVVNLNQEVPPPVEVKGVRINFDNYNLVVERIERAETFRPTGGITKNPFNPEASIDTSSPAPAPSTNDEGLLQAP